MGNATFYRLFYLDSFYFVSTYLTACQPLRINSQIHKNPLAHALLIRKA